MRLAIVGPGRMGRAVAAVARERGHTVVAEIRAGGLTPAAVAQADIAIEFTSPEAAPENLVRLAELGTPTVCGTTGWYDRLDEVRAAFERRRGALVYAPNFSLGVQLLLQLARAAGRLAAARPEFDAWIEETHHRHKQDAPSGTARALRDALRGADPERPYPVTSIRGGEVPGTHLVRFDAGGESLVLAHTARDRSVFARGAVAAAEWLLAAPRVGVFEFGRAIVGGET